MLINAFLRWAERKGGGYYTLRWRGQHYSRLIANLPRVSGPALVAGSAPNPARPMGADHTWYRISVNASQAALEGFGLPPPQMTIFRGTLMAPVPGPDEATAWDQLKGRETELLIVVGFPSEGAVARAAARGYRAKAAAKITMKERCAIMGDVLGKFQVVGGGPSGASHGLFATVLAVKLGANPVVMSGFSFADGWNYDSAHMGKRLHVQGDIRVCRLMRERRLPVYTADPEFSERSGLPLWTGAGA